MENLVKSRQKVVLDEHEVIERILAGEINLFEILMRRNNQFLYRVVKGYVRDREDAEDVMQETYIQAYQKLFQFRGDAAFSTWLARIGINQALRHLRKSSRVLKQYAPDDIGERPDLVKDETTPELKMMQKEMKTSIEKAIENLPEKLRPVFIMREIEGLSVKDVAETLDLTPENVKVRVHRAKKLLQESLYKENVHEGVFSFGNSHCDLMVHKVMQAITELEKQV